MASANGNGHAAAKMPPSPSPLRSSKFCQVGFVSQLFPDRLVSGCKASFCRLLWTVISIAPIQVSLLAKKKKKLHPKTDLIGLSRAA